MRPLDDIRVVTTALYVPGPVAVARLAWLGARVTKVEPPEGDPLAHHAPKWYAELRAGQEVVRLDLKDGRDRAALDVLLARADLLLTAQRPAALARLGLEWSSLHARFPRLAQVAIVGYPAPDAERAGHDLTYLAEVGLLAPPDLPRTLLADLTGAERAVSTALGLLLARERGGEGGYVEVSLADAARDLAAPWRHGTTRPDGPLGGGLPYYGLYRARDGWIAVAALETRFRERLRAELLLPSLARESLDEAFATRTAEEWEAWARERDLPIAAVRAV